MLEIDTDLNVPTWVGRVRVDVFTKDGTWLDSRDYALASPSDLPVSLSLFTKDEQTGRDAFVRVRGYPEGASRQYLGERFFERPTSYAEPAYATSMAAMCASPIALSAGTGSARLQRKAFDDAPPLSCGKKATTSGLAAFSLQVPTAGTYRVEVIAGRPGRDAGDTLLSIRTSCADPTSEVACNDDLGMFDLYSGTIVPLAAGSYFVLVGNKAPSAMDVTVRATLAEAWAMGAAMPSAPTANPSDPPRLVVDGIDTTPATEPDPALAVDRLVYVHVAPSAQSSTHVVLEGDCVGTMANLVDGSSCVHGARASLSPAPLTAGRNHLMTSVSGSWSGHHVVDCSGPAGEGTAPAGVSLHDQRACIRGRAFVLGSTAIVGAGADGATPRRVARVKPFFVDRYEMSVRRYRALKMAGFVSPDPTPIARDLPWPAYTPMEPRGTRCTYNHQKDESALVPEREDLPLNCVSFVAARAICRALGGDLPTVAQRDLMAAIGADGDARLFPWGNDDPTCDTMAFGRWGNDASGATNCLASGVGPVNVDAAPWAAGDLTPEGVVALGGNVSEWTLDAHEGYADPCWLVNGLDDPTCTQSEAPLRSTMGGNWRFPVSQARSAVRFGEPAGGGDDIFGFRCVYSGGAP